MKGYRITMIILFAISFAAANIMLFTGFLRSAAVHSGVLNYYDNSSMAHRVRKIRLRRHWRITLLLFAVAIYAGLSL